MRSNLEAVGDLQPHQNVVFDIRLHLNNRLYFQV